MTDREDLALALYAKWIIEAHGDADTSRWKAEDLDDWQHDRPLNPVGLTKESFLEEADWLLALIVPHVSGQH